MQEKKIWKDLPRERRTPRTVAVSAIDIAYDVFTKTLGELVREEDGTPEDFFTTYFFENKLNNSDLDGDEEERQFFEDIDRDPKAAAEAALLHAISLTVSFAVQAIKARKNSGLAWSFSTTAMYWAGILRGDDHSNRQDNFSEAASQMARRRHAENYALAEDALRHWRENIPAEMSAQKAATELTKVVPLSHKKLAELVSAAKKKTSLQRTTEPERKP